MSFRKRRSETCKTALGLWWLGGREGLKDSHRKENSLERPGEHFKSLLPVEPLTHPVYFISLFVILTHSWEQGKFVLLPLLSSLKNSTPRSGRAYHLAPSWFSLRGVGWGGQIPPVRLHSPPIIPRPLPASRLWPRTAARFSFRGQVRRLCSPQVSKHCRRNVPTLAQ